MSGTLATEHRDTAMLDTSRPVSPSDGKRRGLFITVDGPGGVGKSTLASALAATLAARGCRVHHTAEPSTRPIGALARSVADRVKGRALACLFAADRYDHLAHEIDPRLSAGETVICDRYLASTLVVQQLDGVPAEELLSLNKEVTLPDFAVILTAEADLIRQRLAQRGARNRFQEDAENTAREITLYQEAAHQLADMGVNVLVLDTTSLTPGDAASRIAESARGPERREAMTPALPRRGRTPSVPLLTQAQMSALPARAREVVEYRKSGLSLNHIQGCPLDCAYCIRHTYGLWDQRQPRALMSDAEAVEQLVAHPYFNPDVTPIQVFNRATDPFLPAVRPHTLAVLDDLDSRGLHNHVLVITRHQMKLDDCARIAALRNIKVTLLFTYSGIDDTRIEPYPSQVAAESLKLMSAFRPRRYRTILYWRPLVPGLNDTPEQLARARALSEHADATVFTGLFYRDQIADYYKANGLPEPYDETARRKIVPETLERRVLDAFADSTSLYRKTSCAVSAVHGLPDFNGHIGIGAELCDICPLAQVERCRAAHRVPDEATVRRIASRVPGVPDFEVNDITDRAVRLTGLTEQPRYYLQHALGFQMHDTQHPHRPHRHGRADIGWTEQPHASQGES